MDTGTEVTHPAVTVKSLKAHLSDYLGRVQFGGEQLVITKNGKPAAAIVPVEKLLALQALEDAEDHEAAKVARAEAQTRGTVSLEELKASLGL